MGGKRAPRLVPAVEMRELHPEQRRLQTVEALVVAEFDVFALDPLTQVAQSADPGCKHVVVGADCAAVAECSQVLARIERESRGVSQRSRATTVIGRAV